MNAFEHNLGLENEDEGGFDETHTPEQNAYGDDDAGEEKELSDDTEDDSDDEEDE